MIILISAIQNIKSKPDMRGGNSMLKSHEVLGTDLPIFREKEINHFYLDEIIHLNDNPEKYSVVGYVQVIKDKEIFFKAVYSLD
jgi:hypothetical protein